MRRSSLLLSFSIEVAEVLGAVQLLKLNSGVAVLESGTEIIALDFVDLTLKINLLG